MNQNIIFLIFHYIIRHPELTEKCRKEFFDEPHLRSLFDILQDHIIKYRQPITAETAINLSQLAQLSNEERALLAPENIMYIWQRGQELTQYDNEWIDKYAKAFLSWQTLISGVRNAAAFIKTVQDEIGPENYEEVIQTARLKLEQNTAVNFSDESECIDFYNPESHLTKELNRWSTGIDFLDRCTKGGYWAGSLWVFLGAPKAGKSRLLQNLCAEAIKQGQNSFYASFELQEEIVVQRIGSNLLDITMDDYDAVSKDANLMTKKLKDFQNPLMGARPGYLGVKSFPTSAYSVKELEDYLLKEEERLSKLSPTKEFKFKNIYVDYINIMKNWRNPNSENTYMKIKQIAEDLRAMAMRNGWCVISVTQVKQSFFNANDLDMTSASESSALGATVDFMGGIITDVLLQATHTLYLKSILSRVSPFINERKRFDVDEAHMRLIESNEPIIRDEDIMETFAKKNQSYIKNTTSNTTSSTYPSAPVPDAAMVVNPVGKTVYVSPNLGLTSVDYLTGEGLGF